MAKAKNREKVVAAGKSKKAMLKWVILTATALLVGVGAVFAFNIPGLGKGERVKPANGAVTIPVAKVSDGAAHFFRFSDDGRDIGFFIVKGRDGALHVAFDTCDVCFKEKKGYVQQGDFMVCRNCNQRFASDRIGPHAVGGCNPTYLPARQSAGNIVISVNDLNSGARYF
jgi:uncharacterized membrane protein